MCVCVFTLDFPPARKILYLPTIGFRFTVTLYRISAQRDVFFVFCAAFRVTQHTKGFSAENNLPQKLMTLTAASADLVFRPESDQPKLITSLRWPDMSRGGKTLSPKHLKLHQHADFAHFETRMLKHDRRAAFGQNSPHSRWVN